MMVEELVRRNYSESTRECYIRAVEEFAVYFKCPPDRLGLEHIRIFQAHLFSDRKLSPNTVNQHLAALRFFFVKTLRRSWSTAEEKPWTPIILHLFLGTFHEFGIGNIEGGKPWHCRAVDTTKRGKKECSVGSALKFTVPPCRPQLA